MIAVDILDGDLVFLRRCAIRSAWMKSPLCSKKEGSRTSAARRTPLFRQGQTLCCDSMGELFAYYGACDVAFIGGSLLPHGGQNLIEACAMGVPVLIGPHQYNFADAVELAKSAGAAVEVRDGAELAAEVTRLLKDSAARRGNGSVRARLFARTSRSRRTRDGDDR